MGRDPGRRKSTLDHLSVRQIKRQHRPRAEVKFQRGKVSEEDLLSDLSKSRN